MKKGVLFAVVFLLISFVSAQELVLDIKLDAQSYAQSSNLTYNVLLLEDSQTLSAKLEVRFADASEKQEFFKSVNTNEDNKLLIEKSMSSGYWRISANYEGKNVTRIFLIEENQDVSFNIEGENLVIKNTGNTPYLKTIQIKIGEKIITQKLNIPIGGSKAIRLVAPDGQYNVEVTDGKKTLSEQNIHITGTGNVIGAISEDLLQGSPTLGVGVRDTESEESFLLNKNNYTSIIFVGAIMGLGLLLFIERSMRKKLNRSSEN